MRRGCSEGNSSESEEEETQRAVFCGLFDSSVSNKDGRQTLGCERCHLVLVTSSGSRLCAVVTGGGAIVLGSRPLHAPDES